MARVGFIGLGNMGRPMLRNLSDAGHEATVFDLSENAMGAAVGVGGRPASSPAGVLPGASAVITVLPAGPEVRQIYLGPEGLFAQSAPNTLFIDCSTIDVATARDVHRAAEEKGLRFVDAPMSGGVAGAEAAKLTFMVGGSEDAFLRARPFLECMGKTIVHAGGPGAGQAAKICNNMILGISMIAISEAFVLGEKLGLDNQALFDVASNASGQCWALTSNCPVPGPVPTTPANNDYQPGFAAALMDKDLGLAANAVRANGVEAELGLRAAELYHRFNTEGGGGLDFSAIITDIRDRSTAKDSQ